MTARIRDPELDGFLALSAARLAPRTVDAYRRDLSALAAWLGRPPVQVTTEELERYLAELRADGLSPAHDRAPDRLAPLVLPPPAS